MNAKPWARQFAGEWEMNKKMWILASKCLFIGSSKKDWRKIIVILGCVLR